jgi:Tol biopolymer transport system component
VGIHIRRAWLVTVLTFVTVFGQLLPAVLPAIFDAVASAAFPGANGVIAFQRQVEGTDFDIWTMNGDGSAPRQLTTGPEFDGAAAMSPFGDRIAFQRRACTECDFALWLMNADGTEQTQLTQPDGWDDEFPAWSPDGRFIAYVSTNDGNSDIYRVDTNDGLEVVRLTSSASLDRQPSWSPRGNQIAFDRRDPTGTPRQIVVMNADGTGATALTSDGDNTDPNWSPDGTQMVFTSNRDDGNREIYVMDEDGENQTRLTTDGRFDADPAWSPDGESITFTSNRSGNFEIYTVPATGGAVTLLTSHALSDTFPDWGPTATPRQISGTVRNPAGAPLAGVTVRADDADGGAVIDTGTTDDKGNYRLQVPPGTYVVTFYPPTQDLAVQVYDGHTTGASADPVVVNDGNVLGIDALLRTAHRVTGTVTSAAGPVPNAEVWVIDGESCCYLARAVQTDEAGNYTIGLEGGAYRIRFAAPGYGVQWWDNKNSSDNIAEGWRAADVFNIETPRDEIDAFLTAPALSGVAACRRDAGDEDIVTTRLPGTTVTLLSGSAVVATTQSDSEFATYSFTGLAPNAPYIVQYDGLDSDGVRHACSVNVTTDANGGGAVPESAAVINLGNHNWITAFQMTPGFAVSDVIDRPFRRTFYKLPVSEQQIVTVQLTNLTRNYQLLGYSDIRKAADRLIAAIVSPDASLESVRNLVASGAVSAGDLDSGDLDSGDLDSGDLDSGDLDSGDLDSGDLDSGDLDSGDLDSGDLDSGDLDSGDLDSGDLDSGDLDSGYAITYQSAQRAALRYASGKAGTTPESLTIHTRGYRGDLYFAVLGHDGVFDSSGVFQLVATTVPESEACDLANLTPLAASPVTFPGGKTTLFLTNTAALGLTGTAAENFVDALEDFADNPALNGFAVNGFVYDLETNPNVKTMLKRVADFPNCVPLVNLATDTIKGLIWGDESFQDVNEETFEYVVFAGGDHAIPFRRIFDPTFAGEINYNPPVEGVSGASLANNYYLTDSFYLAAGPVERKGQLVWLTDLHGGRLVESATEILKNISVYNAKGGVFTPTSSLVAGYHFNTDLVDELQTGLQAGGANPVRLPDDVWGAADLRNALLVPNAPRFDVIAPQAHYTATRLIPADNGQRLLSSEIASVADARFEGTVWLTIGCHSGYNIIDADAGDGTVPDAFPEAILGRGGFLYGGTGYQFGDDEILANTEQLLTNVMNEWRYRQDTSLDLYPGGQVALGKALSYARGTYLNELRSVRDIDRKVADVATFYGLPFYRVALSGGRLNRPFEPAISTIAIGSNGLSYSDVVASFSLNATTGSNGGTFFNAGTAHDVAGMAARPILPSIVRPVGGQLGTAPTLAHGAVLRAAEYTTVSNKPVLAIPLTEDSIAQPATFHNSAFSPWMFDLNVLGGTDSLVFTPAQYLSNPDGTAGQLRKYSSIGTRVYYSTRTDASALLGSPLVRSVTLTDVGGRVHVDVTLFTLGTSTVQAAMFTYTGTVGPLSTRWKTVDLVGDAPIPVQGNDGTGVVTVGHLQHWHTVATVGSASRDIDPTDGDTSSPLASVNDVFGVLQAVGDTGDVVVDTKQMRLYSIPRDGATAATPKIPTVLAFTTLPATPTTYGASLTVAARLSSPGVGDMSGKRVIFRLGRASVSAITAGDGSVSATVPVNVFPGSHQLGASFAEDDTALGSFTQAPLVVAKASPAFVPASGSAVVHYSDNVALAVLRTPTGQLLRWQPVTLTRSGVTPGVATFTDGTGTIRLDTMDFGGLGAGSYEIIARYPGDNLRFLSATSGAFTVAVQREQATIATAPAPQQTGSVTVQGTLTQDGPPLDRAPGDIRLAVIHYVGTNESGVTFSGDAAVGADGTWTFTRTLGPGVYNILLSVGGSYFTASTTAIAVVYDPTTFGTGGGYVLTTGTTQPTVPAGKKANFGFNVKYKGDGTMAPTGSLLFQLKEANIDLKATSFDWLVISTDGAGKKADFQGKATINGSGSYTFRVIARDLPSGDTFSIEVRDANGVPVASSSGTLGGGSIKVH